MSHVLLGRINILQDELIVAKSKVISIETRLEDLIAALPRIYYYDSYIEKHSFAGSIKDVYHYVEDVLGLDNDYHNKWCKTFTPMESRRSSQVYPRGQIHGQNSGHIKYVTEVSKNYEIVKLLQKESEG